MKIERTETVAYVLIGIGVVLLILTFYMAFTLLIAKLGILTGANLSEALGKILGPMVEAIIKVLYLGIMGWTGSIATIRGIQLYREYKQTQQQQKTEPPQPKNVEKEKA